jgi:outer membrane protein, heavy metal efflux system
MTRRANGGAGRARCGADPSGRRVLTRPRLEVLPGRAPQSGRRAAGASRLLVLALALAGALSGCATYHPEPLDDARLSAALAPPAPGVLSQAAARLTHPRLAPIRLDLSQPLTPDELAVIAVLVNPELKALRLQERVAQAQVFAAGLLPDPVLTGGADWPVGVPAGQVGIVTAFNVAVTWAVAALVTRHADLRVARAEADRVRWDVAWQEWLVANQARLLAQRSSLLERQRALAEGAAQITGHVLDLTRQNLEQGNATVEELGLREVGYLDARDRALTLGRAVEKARQELNRTLGLPPDERVRLAEVRVSLTAPADPAALFERARQDRLDLTALRAGYASQEARVYRAVLGQFPGVGVGVTRARDTTDIVAQGFQVSLDIPLFNRNRGAIAVARATRDQLWSEYVARLHQTRADIATLVAELERVVQQHAALSRELPALGRAEEAMRTAVESGDVTLVSYETVRAARLDKELTQLALEQSAAEGQQALNIAVGASLGP